MMENKGIQKYLLKMTNKITPISSISSFYIDDVLTYFASGLWPASGSRIHNLALAGVEIVNCKGF